MSGNLQHEEYMRRCRQLAQEALRGGDAPVGSLVLREGRIIAEGVEGVKARKDVTAHAEIIAIRKACAVLGMLDLSGCTLLDAPGLRRRDSFLGPDEEAVRRGTLHYSSPSSKGTLGKAARPRRKTMRGAVLRGKN